MTVPAGVDHQITCKFTDVLGFSTIAELTVNGLQFSKSVNLPGPWQGTLNVEDSNVRETAWLEATAVNRTALWVDIDGALLYGGMTTQRQYQSSSGVVSLSGSDFCGYLA